MVTSNHVHVLVADDGGRDVIPNSIQLVAGRTGQDDNQGSVTEMDLQSGVFFQS